MTKIPKKTVLLFGGKSAEHEVSVKSASNIFEAMDKNKYEVQLIFIDKLGEMRVVNQDFFKANSLEHGVSEPLDIIKKADVAFPVLHGPYGEDGTIQGLLRSLDVPFVGSNVLGSAVAMDKDITKRLLRDAGLPVGKFIAFASNSPLQFEEVSKELGLPFFVKPANLGSSVGVTKVTNENTYHHALTEASQFDKKIITEEFTPGRELECAVLGNDTPEASPIGEIVPHREFYSYEAKYLAEDGASLIVPADLDRGQIDEIQKLSIQAFTTLGCAGLARVDFFMKTDGSIVISEVNTIPGFTSISMYPKLWEQAGVSYPALIDRLIELAIERFNQEKTFRTSY